MKWIGNFVENLLTGPSYTTHRKTLFLWYDSDKVKVTALDIIFEELLCYGCCMGRVQVMFKDTPQSRVYTQMRKLTLLHIRRQQLNIIDLSDYSMASLHQICTLMFACSDALWHAMPRKQKLLNAFTNRAFSIINCKNNFLPQNLCLVFQHTVSKQQH